jgi:hypothetical protein
MWAPDLRKSLFCLKTGFGLNLQNQSNTPELAGLAVESVLAGLVHR